MSTSLNRNGTAAGIFKIGGAGCSKSSESREIRLWEQGTDLSGLAIHNLAPITRRPLHHHLPSFTQLN
jgi:hypothetical protein